MSADNPARFHASSALPQKASFRYITDSVMNVPLLAELVDQCDVVYHMAAAVGVKLIVESPVRTIETNVRGTEIVLELANKKKRKVLVMSTSEVYGKSAKIPFCEDDDLVLGPTVKGRWAYACSRLRMKIGPVPRSASGATDGGAATGRSRPWERTHLACKALTKKSTLEACAPRACARTLRSIFMAETQRTPRGRRGNTAGVNPHMGAFTA